MYTLIIMGVTSDADQMTTDKNIHIQFNAHIGPPITDTNKKNGNKNSCTQMCNSYCVCMFMTKLYAKKWKNYEWNLNNIDKNDQAVCFRFHTIHSFLSFFFLILCYFYVLLLGRSYTHRFILFYFFLSTFFYSNGRGCDYQVVILWFYVATKTDIHFKTHTHRVSWKYLKNDFLLCENFPKKKIRWKLLLLI